LLKELAMNTPRFLLAALLTLGVSQWAVADTLLIQRVQNESGTSLPKRGASMSSVEKTFGAPTQKFAAVGGPNIKKRNPPITRWVYPNFTVYFEHSYVVDAVLNKATAEEMGPKPATK
jgi:hypothetical protein